jgi:ankyrin repeat protein
MTSLRYAVRHGRDELVDLLRAAGADAAAVTDEDRWIGAVVRGDVPGATPAGGARPAGRTFEDRDLLALAAARNDAALVRRLLAAGADPNTPVGGTEAMPPLHWACWRGQPGATRALLDAGADVHQRNRYGGDALGAALHGSLNCHDPLGGPTTKLPDEIAHGDYPGVVEMLIAAGALLPPQVGGNDAVGDVLRSHGVKDAE